jgi:dimethylaniline monooxygenase (N-oxide forming)
MTNTSTLPQTEGLNAGYSTETAPERIDPYWNFVARTALMYSLPVLAFAYCLYQGWIGRSRDFWIPLLAIALILPAATSLRTGRPFAYRDYQGRESFPWTYVALPASLWCMAVHLLPSLWLDALSLCSVLLIHDALLMRYRLLYIYFAGPETSGVTGCLLRFNLPWWSYFSLCLAATHVFSSDNLASIVFGSILIVIPAALLWLYWRKHGGRPQGFGRISRVAVVGGGWSGIYAVKALHEAGMDVTCFEGTDSIGGVWKYRADRPGGVFEATRVTSSKHFLHPSDFPFPASSPEFPHHTEVLEHLVNYVDRFGIRGRFRLSVTVDGVEPVGERWRVTTRNQDGEQLEEMFDAVVVSSGPHQNANVSPGEHPLYSRFTGRLIHSAEYKTSGFLQLGERVLIVGAGESSADIVSEGVNVGAVMHWASRSGQWFADRNMGPYPADHITTQGLRVFVGLFGFWEYMVRRFVTGAFVNLAWGRGGHGVAQWLPDTPYLHQFLNKSRDGLLQVYAGKVAPHRGPVRVSGRDVYFAGEDDPVAIDTIILSTGYRPVWPFLKERPKSLFKLVFHPDTATLAFVGFARPIVGSIPSLSELQARWVAKVWSGMAELPGRERRITESRYDAQQHKSLIRDASEYGILVEQELYATQVASRFNAHVHWAKLLVLWPRAFFVMLASPWAPFKYRLNDQDPQSRRDALAHTLAEMPSAVAPSYLLAVGLLVTVLWLAGVVTLVFRSFESAVALGLLSLMGLGLCCLFRFTERERPRRRKRKSRLREVFPF